MVCCYLVHEVLNMTENNKVCFEDCKMYFTTTKKYQRQKEKRQLYLTQILQVKDFIIEGLENNFEAKMLYDYLEFKKAVLMNCQRKPVPQPKQKKNKSRQKRRKTSHSSLHLRFPTGTVIQLNSLMNW